MPYCPKCKTEYVDGIIECVDCHLPLIDSEKDLMISPEFLISVETELARRIKEFLGYSGIDVTMKFDPKVDLFDIYVANNQLEHSTCLLKLLLANEAMDIKEQQVEQDELLKPMTYSYVSTKERYENLHSSAVSFFIVGILILCMISLSLVILPLPILGINNPFGTVVMAVIGIVCIVTGVSSNKKADALKNNIQTEENQTDGIIRWFTSTYTPIQIDHLVRARRNFFFETYGIYSYFY
jgi:hypothetical protein